MLMRMNRNCLCEVIYDTALRVSRIVSELSQLWSDCIPEALARGLREREVIK